MAILTLVTLIASASFAIALPWSADGALPRRRNSPGTANSTLVSSTESPTPSLSIIPPASESTCSGSVFLFGSAPKTVYTTVTRTYIVTGFELFKSGPTYVTPLPPCITHDCGSQGNGTCDTQPVFTLPTTLISVTKKTTVFEIPSSVNPPMFSGIGSPGGPTPPQTTGAPQEPGDFMSWIESMVEGMRPSSVLRDSSRIEPSSARPEITPPPNGGRKNDGKGGTDRVERYIGPDGKTTFILSGVPITIHDDKNTMVLAIPQTTITMNDHALPMTLVASHSIQPVALTINTSAVICNGTTVRLIQPSSTRSTDDDATLTGHSISSSTPSAGTRGGGAGGEGEELTDGPSTRSPPSINRNSAQPTTVPCALLILSLISIMVLLYVSK
ncbi:hypothetical protein CIHG_07430 [Coccidioides immitis H538.4]|uniref:Uncharacterized protein n=2 Tax=Coccidioides immitis TaxID=5501 RepID=A0A0J8UQ29_COCIT|nr:hypothetical protein CIRG_02428 [Coccidioides immitis RMSCC 2394]KMU89623.1 hypothetical protein CIHG_07430 [Coccidioides immitis H538.4]TPX23213.1 hypothetical protein DIZ76_012539 [Coccidioides immitis]